LETLWKGNKWDEVANLGREQRQALFGQLVQQAPRYLDQDRTRVRSFVRALYPDGLRPTEAQYLLMLAQDLNDQPRPSDKLIDLALTVHSMAEEVAVAAEGAQASANVRPLYAYSERVSAWTADTVQKADQERRWGEDWLFGARQQAWAEAEKHLTNAQTLYKQAEQNILILREALNLRDEVLAELPYYSHWLASRRLSPDPTRRSEEEKTREQKLRLAEQLWQETHQLALGLQEPKANPSPDLKKNAQLVREEFKVIKNDFEESCKTLDNVAQQSLWHGIEAALSIPLIEPDIRLQLLKSSQRISTKLQTEYSPGTPAIQRRDAEQNESRDIRLAAAAAASHQGRMAVAVIGQPWIDEEKKQTHAGMGYEELHDMVMQKGEGESWKSLNEAGGQLARLWQRLPQEVQEISAGLNDSERWRRPENAAQYLAALTTKLTQAEQLCRLLDGAGAGVLSSNPVAENRRLRLHQLLLRQAERAWRDHWWCTQEEAASAKDPYFVLTVKAYVEAARDVVTQDVDNKDLATVRKRLVEKKGEEFKQTQVTTKLLPSSPTDLTTEQQFQLGWSLTADNVPEGVAMFRLNLEGSLEPANGKDDDKLRQPCSLSGKGKEPVMQSYLLKSPDLQKAEAQPPLKPTDETAVATLEGFYRGQPIRARADLKLHLGAETIVYQHPPPEDARIAAWADIDVPLGSIAIVLDCSGSMRDVLKDGRRKIDVARGALKDVLGTLPLGTRLSLWAFAHKEAKTRSTIEQIRKPFILGAAKQEQLQQMMVAVNNLTPYYETPLLQSMIQAKGDLQAKRDLQAKGDLKDESGFRTLIVLTDGYDNAFKGNFEAEIRNQFDRSGIVINMVLFSEDQKEIAKAQSQFKGPIMRLRTPGNWFEAQNGQQLAVTLPQAMRPRLRLLQEGEPVPGIPEDLEVTFSDETALHWSGPLKPGRGREQASHIIYQAVVNNASQNVLLDRGDCLLLRLRADELNRSRIRFERSLIADHKYYGARWTVKKKPWQLSVLENMQGRSGASSLELMVALENWEKVRPQGERSVLGQWPPGFKWFELKAGTPGRFGVRWQNEAYYPAPVWRCNVADWPGDVNKPARPELDAWWIDNTIPDTEIRTLRHKDSAIAFEDEFKQQTRVDDVQVWIESVTVEQRAEPGGSETTPCLVVRLRHEPKDKPVWVWLTGLDAKGAEHRFYSEAGKVTALFRKITHDYAQENGFALNLISLVAFKQKAERDGYHVTSRELNLPAPSPQDSRPEPVKRTGD
jgi:hypothetical protein